MLALAARSVQLTLRSDDKVYRIAFDRGLVIAASSPSTVDSAVRVALTGHFITPAIAHDIKRRIAAAPNLDEVEVIAAAARLTPDQVYALRVRLVTQRAARTFSADRGEYELEERAPLSAAGAGIDVGSIIYLGVRMNLSEERLAADLRKLGTRFALKAEAVDTLARFGFARAEQPVLDALRRGTSLPELEAEHRDLDPRVAQAIIYALAVCDALVPAGPLRRLVIGGAARASSPSLPSIARAATPPAMLGRAPTQIGSPIVAREPTPPAKLPRLGSAPPVSTPKPPPLPLIVARVPPVRPRSAAIPPPIPPPSAAGVPRLVDPHAQATARAVVSRSMIDAFRTNKTTTVRPNALAAHEVVALIKQRTALLDDGADHFALLGVSLGAPVEDVHAAYVELSRHLRPNRLEELGISDEGFLAQRLLAQLGIAFTVLTDRIQRSEYLASLQSAQRQVGAGARPGARHPRAIRVAPFRTRALSSIP